MQSCAALLSTSKALQRSWALPGALRYSTNAASSMVCFADPKYLLDKEARAEVHKQQGGERTAIFASVPNSLLDHLSEAKFVKGDSDSPESHWIVGEPTEMFQYKLLGIHKVSSGFTCIMDAPNAKAGQGDDAMPDAGGTSYKEFESMAKEAAATAEGGAGEHTAWWPSQFKWCGRLTDCASAAVYVRKDGKGMWIHSIYDPLDW